MLKFYFVLLAAWLGSTSILYAQTSDPLREKLDLVFTNLNKTQIPNGHLEEYGFPGIGNGLKLGATKSIGRFAGRAIPVLGWGLAAYDAGMILYNTQVEFNRITAETKE